MLRSILPPSLALLTTVLAAAPAWPCSPALPSLWGPTAPTDGEGGVPTNARLVIDQSFPATNASAFLSVDGGEERAVGLLPTGRLLFVNLEGLAPDTAYTLRFEVPDDGMTEGRDPVHFTTGAAADDTAPTMPTEVGDPEVEFHAGNGLMLDSCGGGGQDQWNIKIPLAAASDDVGVAGYRLLEVDERGGRIERFVRLESERAAGDDFLYDWRTTDGEITYVVEAFDLAGNTVESEPFGVGLFYGGGCSATFVPRGGAPLAALSLLAGLVGLLRRRRVS